MVTFETRASDQKLYEAIQEERISSSLSEYHDDLC